MATAQQGLVWLGNDLRKKITRAEKRGLGFTRAKAVRHAKKNHPGWRSRSGRAEKSIRSQGKIEDEAGVLVARWGSRVFYVLFLEIDHGRFLQASADATYPGLAAAIKRFLTEG